MAGPIKKGRSTWEGPLNTPAELVGYRGVPGEVREIVNDGDDKPAQYAWNPVTESWIKISDPDGAGPGGATDHGALTGLGDHDHLQYPLIPVDIADGGTGAITASDARDNLEVVERPPDTVTTLWGGPDFLSKGYRPWATPGVTPSTIYIDVAGDDDTGDGTLGNPFATLERAIQIVPISQGTGVTLQLGPGTFVIPQTLSVANWCWILGTKTVAETRNIINVVAQTNKEGLVFEVDGSVLADDEWRGRLIRFSGWGGPVNGYGWVYRNTGNILETTMNLGDFPNGHAVADITGRSISLYSLDTELIFDITQPVAIASVQIEIRDCSVFDPDAVMFIIASGKPALANCYIEIKRLQPVTYGRCDLYTSYLANRGAGVPSGGVLRATDTGHIHLADGSVLDCDLNITNPVFSYVDIENGASVTFDKEVVIRGLNTSGIQVDGGNCFLGLGVTQRTMLRLIDCDAAFVINSTAEGAGGRCQLPPIYGVLNTTGNNYSKFAVVAQKGAQVELPLISDLTPETGIVNSVSSNNGFTAWAEHPDGTRIVGGHPPPWGYRYAASDFEQGHVLADNGNRWVLANTDSTLDPRLFQVEALAPSAVAEDDLVAGVTLGALAPIQFWDNGPGNEPAVTGVQVYLDELHPGYASYAAPLVSGHAIVMLGILEEVNGTYLPLVRFDPEVSHVL